MTKYVSQIRNELADREAIRDCLHRYARGLDRVDAELLRSLYWEDATCDTVVYQGAVSGFIEFIIPTMQGVEQSAHLLGNMLIEIDGATAAVETYFIAFYRSLNAAGVAEDHFSGGRYLDRMELRHDDWRISHRQMIIDWFRDQTDSADWSRGFRGLAIQPGARKPHDPSYSILGLR